MAEGPPIQRAAQRALAKGMTTQAVLDMVVEFRKADQDTPIILMGYTNPLVNWGYEAIARDYGASNDIGRVGLPEEVATMVVFLCSELCNFVVGATIPVDGGTDFF